MTHPLDREGPTRRPARRAVMLQRWRDLAFLHWEVPVAALRAVVPEALSIDLFEGRAFVGLVPFTIEGVRPTFAPPMPWVSSFHEVNVRTYVHHRGAGPGVFFFSLDAARLLAVVGARASYRLPYFHADMSFDRKSPVRQFHSVRRGAVPARCELHWSAGADVRTASLGSLEHFLVERYLLYAWKGGRLTRAQVHHAPYPLRDATALKVEETLISAAGIVRPSGPPPLVHASDGVDVEVFAPERVS